MDKITGTRKTTRIFIIDGYRFRIDKVLCKQLKMYLRCTRKGCRARGIIYKRTFKPTFGHNHSREKEKISLMGFHNEPRLAARTSPESSKGASDEVVSTHHLLAAQHVSFECVRRNMYKVIERRDSFPPAREETQSVNPGVNLLDESLSEIAQSNDETPTRDMDQDPECSENGSHSLDTDSHQLLIKQEYVEPEVNDDSQMDISDHEVTIKQEYEDPEVVVKKEQDQEISKVEAVQNFESVFITSNVDNERNNLTIKTEVEENLKENPFPAANERDAFEFSGYDQGPPSTTGPVISSTSVLSCSSAPTVSVVTTFPSSVTTTTVSTVTGLMSTMVPVIPTQGTSFDSTQQFFFYNSQQASNIVMLPPQQNILSCAPMVVPKFSNEVQKPKKLRAIAPAQSSMNNTPQNSLPKAVAKVVDATKNISSSPVPFAQTPTQAATTLPVPFTQNSTQAATSLPVPFTQNSTQAATSLPVPFTQTPTQAATTLPVPFAQTPTQAATSLPVPFSQTPTQAATSLPVPFSQTPTQSTTSLPVPFSQTPTQAATSLSVPFAQTPTQAATSLPVPFSQTPTQAATSLPVPFSQTPTQAATSLPVPFSQTPTQAATSLSVPFSQTPTQAATSLPTPFAQTPTQAVTSSPKPFTQHLETNPSPSVHHPPCPAQHGLSQFSSAQTNNKPPIQLEANRSLISSFLEQFYTETANMIKIDLTSVPECSKRGITMKFKELCEAIFCKMVHPNNIIIAFPLC